MEANDRTYERYRELLRGRRLPAVVVDLDAFDRNVDRVAELGRRLELPVRIATKSIRVTALALRIQRRHPRRFGGALAFAIGEAVHLLDAGFDDVLVAYPAYQRSDIELAVDLRRRRPGKRLRLIVDSPEGVERVGDVARPHGLEIDVLLCVDMASRLGPVHVGARRSPLRENDAIVNLARHATATDGVRFAGLMGYEAQVAGVQDDNPFEPLLNPAKVALRRQSIRDVARRRAAMVEALVDAGLAPSVVNGGGSGSLDSTTRASGVTETTAGSAFLKPHMFDYYTNEHMRAMEPAFAFALEVTRRPRTDIVTCLGGGYIASGPAHRDKVPLPFLPRGASLLTEEMTGEVQTPVRLSGSPHEVHIGDPIFFRHAKGGELAERFTHYLLVESGRVVGEVPTYRGEGLCFF